MTTEKASLDNVMRNLNKEVNRIQNKSLKGLIKAAAYVRRDMDKTSPLIPTDAGNLRESWFTVASHLSANRPFVLMGFSANYAEFVHEMVGAKFQRPGAGAKFFEAAINRNHEKILEIIRKEARIKK